MCSIGMWAEDVERRMSCSGHNHPHIVPCGRLTVLPRCDGPVGVQLHHVVEDAVFLPWRPLEGLQERIASVFPVAVVLDLQHAPGATKPTAVALPAPGPCPRRLT